MKHAQEYWSNRLKEQGSKFAMHMGRTDAENLATIAARKEFFKKNLGDLVNKSTIDYGCGMQLYKELFSDYQGVDIVQAHPDTRVLKGTCITNEKLTAEHLFCTNVLQHNEDPEPIIAAWKKIKGLKYITIYEWTNGKTTAGHCFSRTHEQYDKLIGAKSKRFTHVADGFEHTLMLYDLRRTT